MAAEQIKRKLPTKVAAMKARKRQKIDGHDGKLVKPQAAQLPKGGKVRLEKLDWNQVAIPENLDDFEGLYGLEEIDDVDIVKDVASGTVSYVQTGSSNPSTNGTGGDQKGKFKSTTTDAADETQGGPDDDFEGFSDKESIVLKPAVSVKKAKGQAKSSAKSKTSDATKANNQSAAKRTANVNHLDLEHLDKEDSNKIVEVDIEAWKSLKLSPDTLAGLSRMGFAKPTPIQSASIPEILAGHDVVGKATTGSGKTLAFGIPIFETFLETYQKRKGQAEKAPLALIMSPTRELAHQLGTHLTDLCRGLPHTSPAVATLTGGLSLHKQQRLLKNADIVVGTPGRLWEIISGGIGIAKSIQQIKYLVIDEADRLLSQGRFKELEEIFRALDREEVDEGVEGNIAPQKVSTMTSHDRQTLVFSATFHKGLQQKLSGKSKSTAGMADKESMEYLLAKLKFREEKPKYIDVNPTSQMAQRLKEGLVECGGTEKDLYLYALLLLHPTARTLVFVNSISAVRRLTPFLQNLSLPALALHSQMPQKARLRSIERFTGTTKTPGFPADSTKGSILVATDVAARGLDIPHVQLVIHYHLPRTADTYVHRSGRTARAGESGSSILLCGPEEVAGVRRLVAKVHAQSAAAAQLSRSAAARNGYFIRSLDMDRRVVARLKPRATLAKQLADVVGAKEKKSSNDDVFKQAAEDMGVDYDSEELENGPGKRGRGAGRMKRERENASIGKDEMRAARAELNALLKQRVNVGVSERYPTAGSIDIDELLKEGDARGGEFLGSVRGVAMDD